MTVKELIEKLKEFPEDLEVMSGCSCSGHEIQTVKYKTFKHRIYDGGEDYVGKEIESGQKVWIE